MISGNRFAPQAWPIALTARGLPTSLATSP
jgi:hypothetical protein